MKAGKMDSIVTRGFTLIELLVVIAIIVLLLSIIVPALGRAQNKAEAVICASTLKLWSTAAKQYSLDYKNSVLVFSYDRGEMFHGILAPYLGLENWEVDPANVSSYDEPFDASMCPTVDEIPAFTQQETVEANSGYLAYSPKVGSHTKAWGYFYTRGTYALTQVLSKFVNRRDGSIYTPAKNFNRYSNAPGETPLMIDSALPWIRPENWTNSPPPPPNPPDRGNGGGGGGTFAYAALYRHGGAYVNLNFVDGSVATQMPLWEIYNLRWCRGFKRTDAYKDYFPDVNSQ